MIIPKINKLIMINKINVTESTIKKTPAQERLKKNKNLKINRQAKKYVGFKNQIKLKTKNSINAN